MSKRYSYDEENNERFEEGFDDEEFETEFFLFNRAEARAINGGF